VELGADRVIVYRFDSAGRRRRTAEWNNVRGWRARVSASRPRVLLRLNRIPGATPGPSGTRWRSTKWAPICPASPRSTSGAARMSTTRSELEGRRLAPQSWERVRARLDHTVVGRPSTRSVLRRWRCDRCFDCQTAVLQRFTDQRGSRNSILSRRWRRYPSRWDGIPRHPFIGGLSEPQAAVTFLNSEAGIGGRGQTLRPRATSTVCRSSSAARQCWWSASTAR